MSTNSRRFPADLSVGTTVHTFQVRRHWRVRSRMLRAQAARRLTGFVPPLQAWTVVIGEAITRVVDGIDTAAAYLNAGLDAVATRLRPWTRRGRHFDGIPVAAFLEAPPDEFLSEDEAPPDEWDDDAAFFASLRNPEPSYYVFRDPLLPPSIYSVQVSHELVAA